jgi:hypothetical protein
MITNINLVNLKIFRHFYEIFYKNFQKIIITYVEKKRNA